MPITKKMKQRQELIPDQLSFPIDEAVELLLNYCKEVPRNFDETIEASFRLGIEAKKAEQQLRGTLVLPHGTGRTPRIVVFAQGDKAQEAEEAGADHVGGEELAEKIQKEGWLDFDIAISTPDMMKVVGKLGKILGPRGMMPNPKSGTVTFDISSTVDEFKKGKVEYRNDKFGVVAVPIGKSSFSHQQLAENFKTLYHTILKVRPSAAKGQYIKSVAISSTMGPGLKIDQSSLVK